MSRPYYVLFAGVNGAGKSTLYHTGMWQHGGITNLLPRINSDEILAAHGWDWNNDADQLRAGREARALIKSHFAQRVSFNQETTLTGRSIIKNIQHAHEAGYYLVMFYIGVEHPSIAQERIAYRQTKGGHGIEPRTVTRRFRTSIDNLVKIIDICNESYLYDNTKLLNMVARFEFGELAYCAAKDPAITWHHKVITQLGYELINWPA